MMNELFDSKHSFITDGQREVSPASSKNGSNNDSKAPSTLDKITTSLWMQQLLQGANTLANNASPQWPFRPGVVVK